jgi:hypothetical protein
MKRFSPLAAVLALAAPLAARAAIYQEPGERAGKPFTVSVLLRGEYDDNIYARYGDKVASWKSGIQPSFVLNLPYERTLISARYTFNLWYYADRPGQDTGMSHEFLGRVAHTFSQRCDVDIRDRFAYTYEPDLAVSGGGGTPNVNGDYWVNHATATLRFQWTPRFGQVLEYGNTVLQYLDDRVGDTQNYVGNDVKLENRFQVHPRTVLVLAGIFGHTDYDEFERGSTAWTVAGGVDQKLLEKWIVSARAGATWMSPEDGDNATSPYWQINTDYKYLPGSAISLSYTHYLSLTDIASYSRTVSDAVALGITHAFTPKFVGRVRGGYTYNEYQSRFLVNGLDFNEEFDEYALFLDASLSYAFSRFLSLEMGYTFTDLSSDLPDRSYERNRYYLGLRASF